jgi:hypothetical protein
MDVCEECIDTDYVWSSSIIADVGYVLLWIHHYHCPWKYFATLLLRLRNLEVKSNSNVKRGLTTSSVDKKNDYANCEPLL